MSVVLGGQRVEIPGVETICWLDDQLAVPKATDGRPRRAAVRSIVAHTVSGVRSHRLVPGPGKPSKAAEWYARYQAKSERVVSWHFTVDRDGTVAWSADPLAWTCWHANTVNDYSAGFEMLQDEDGTMYEATIRAAVAVILFLVRFEHPLMAVQAQMPWRDGRPDAGLLWRAGPEYATQCGRNLVGVYGHRNVWVWRSHQDAAGKHVRTVDSKGRSFPDTVRGFGDPNDYLFDALHARGFETFEMGGVGAYGAPLAVEPEDVRAWKVRQQLLGFTGKDLDGVPGPATRAALRRAGHPDGIYATLTV